MPNFQGAPLEEQVKKLLEQNLQYSREIYVQNKKIKNYILWGRIMSTISLLLILLPLIAAAIFLPSFIKDLSGKFGPSAAVTGRGSNQGLNNLLNGTGVSQQDLINSIKEQGGPVNSFKNILDLYTGQSGQTQQAE